MTAESVETKAPVVTIRRVRANDDAGLAAVAALHEELLPFGPIAALGAGFLKVVAYRAPVRDGLLELALAEVDGKPAGFVAWMADSERFHAEAMSKHVLLAGAQLALALVRDPRRLRAMPRILRTLRSRTHDDEDRSSFGEVIGIGARPDYLTAKFRKQSGSWLSRDLVAFAAEDLHKAGKNRLRMFVAAENKRTLLLYQLLGAQFERVEHGGEPTMAVTFALPFGVSSDGGTG
jgi:ribosomal protein S18 acetylase RimI-like enzyme